MLRVEGLGEGLGVFRLMCRRWDHKQYINGNKEIRHAAIAGIEELRLHNLGNKLLTCLIPTLLHPATMGIEVWLNCEERGCEIVERRYAD
jgi:hypothetical protein